MLIDFFLHLKSARLPVSTREFLTLLEALEARVVSLSLDDFYFLARAALVKDEAQFDRFDLAFASYFKGVEAIFDIRAQIPEEWLRKEFERLLTDDDRRAIEALGGFDKLMQTFKERLAEQRERHAGGRKWIGTGGTSSLGAYGFNTKGIRIGDTGRGQRTAVKVWDERSFRNLDGDVELNTRNLKVALRKLRRFAREGVPEELDLDGTIEGTARNAGWLDLRLVAERRNRVKVLLFLDVGGSMDPHVQVCEELFSAAKSEFRHLEHFYFHNCVYDHVWRDNARRRRGDEPVRAHAGSRQRRVHERRAGSRLAQAPRRAFPQVDLVESRARPRVGVHTLDADRAERDRTADVSAHARRCRARYRRVTQVADVPLANAIGTFFGTTSPRAFAARAHRV